MVRDASSRIDRRSAIARGKQVLQVSGDFQIISSRGLVECRNGSAVTSQRSMRQTCSNFSEPSSIPICDSYATFQA